MRRCSAADGPAALLPRALAGKRKKLHYLKKSLHTALPREKFCVICRAKQHVTRLEAMTSGDMVENFSQLEMHRSAGLCLRTFVHIQLVGQMSTGVEEVGTLVGMRSEVRQSPTEDVQHYCNGNNTREAHSRFVVK